MAALPDSRSDEQLMSAYVAGDRDAFRLLFDRYAGVLHGLARRRLGNETEARDVVQQTFLQLHRARNDFRPGAQLRPWLFTIAMNLIRGQYRSTKRRGERSFEGEQLPSSVEVAEIDEAQLERAARIREALRRLPAQQREVLELHWFEDSPYEEIARVVGASVAAVRIRAHRGYERLRKLLPDLR